MNFFARRFCIDRIAAGTAWPVAAMLAVLLGPLQISAKAEPVTYSDDVAPIIFQHCANCHRPGQAAPMSLLSYKETRPWAKSIAQKVLAGEMPPWSGESDRREWSNDISLSQEQIDTIVQWVEQGARQGDPMDVPPVPTFSDSWTLGEPDHIITLNEISIPAGGDDLFPKQTLTVDLGKPRWIRAIEFLPGDRRAAHHSQVTYNTSFEKGAKIGSEQASGAGILGVWTAGMPPFVFPDGMGRVLGAKTEILVDSHYHPFGEATTDRTKIGLYFGKGKLKKEVATLVTANMGLRIPPGEPHHAERAFHLFDRDMQIVAFSPHMHVRGKAMRYDLIYPDGRKETLLDVPKYNYNWQWQYYPTEPIDAPAGSRLEVTAVWDNSADNAMNPDPSKEIIYRGNVFNEMFVGFFEAIEKEGVYHNPLPPREKLASILKEHKGEDSYLIGGFLPFGIYAPREGEGWLYLAQGGSMFSISLDDFSWNGSKLSIRTQFPTPEASATLTLIEAELDESGRLKGKLRYGVDSAETLEMQFVGQSQTGD